jgi:RNA polymerase subunit RPABC4/transcription elongation factor Spt4
MKMKMHCWKCNLSTKKIKDKFHGFLVNAWKCNKCKEIIFDEKEIQPILQYNKLKEKKKELIVTIGVLGKSKIFRVPKIAEQLYDIYKGEKFKFDLEPDKITIKMKN